MFKLSNTVLIPILTLCSLSVSAQWAKVYTTAGDRSQEMEPSAVEATSVTANYTVDTSTKYQGVDGFGCAITYASCYNVMKMSETMREELLKRTFSPTDGYGVSYVRISIGCNDFSSGDYTLCDTQGPDDDLLQNFGLHSDEINYVIPMLKKIKALNPNLKIIASPWTPPLWMKTSNSWKGEELSSTYYSTYADYFVKFVQAFQAEGLDIYAVTHQNEPMNRGNSASCYMSWETAGDFISQALAPKFKAAGLTTKIYLWDHNYNYDNESGQTDYPYHAIQRMGTDFDGADLVAGAAWHNYVDNPETSYTEMTDIYNKTGKENLFTESSIGTWNNGDNLAGSLARDMRNNIILPMSAYCRGSIVWNFALDVNGKPYVSGGCNTCRGAISVAEDGSSYTCNSHYYDMAHASVSVKVGATNVATSGSMSDVTISSFLNPDGTVGVLIANTNSSAQTVNVACGSYTYSFAVPANGVVCAELGMSETDAKSDWVTLPSTTIYYDNTLTQWDTPYVFMWGSGNNATWPGAAMTLVHGNLWKYTTNGLYTGMVFNAGDGDATKGEDHTVTDSKIYANATADALGAPEDVTHTIYFDNSKAKWSQPYVYAWYSNATGTNASWPGVAMTRTSADSDIWKLAVPDFYDRLVVTNGLDGDDELKTDDQVLTDGATYTYVPVVTTDYYITGTLTGWVAPGSDGSYQMVQDEDGTIYYNVTYSSTNSTSDLNRFQINLKTSEETGWGTKYGISDTSGIGSSNSKPLPGPVTAVQLKVNGGDIYYASNLDGTYKTIFDPEAVTLTILDPDPEIIYVSGSFNDWKEPGQDGAVPLTYTDQGYYLGYVTLIGSGELCLYTGSGWSGLRYGLKASTSKFTDDNLAITLDSGVGDNQNVAYDLTEGLYRFTFNPTSQLLTIYRAFSSGINSISSDNVDTPVFYNLMGQRVERPTTGVYIRVVGTKVQKIVY
ncbi:MAG: starch-binding protein [Bacteroidales bacterium]|nr:starch-binding protein [Bacteroidales bacterium]